jgi:hypothetical protein
MTVRLPVNLRIRLTGEQGVDPGESEIKST